MLIIIATYATGGSCDSCNRNRNRNRTTTPKSTPTTPIDKSDAASITSSGYASDSDGGPSSGSSGSSNFSSGSASSSRSSSPAPPTDFAGLTNIGNTCYMNAALQIIAALYADKVEGHDGLKKLVNKINHGHQPLTNKEMEEFVKSLPDGAKKMAQSGRQEDLYEFISNLTEATKFLDPIQCTESFFRTQLFNLGVSKRFYKYDNNKPDFHCEANGGVLTIDIDVKNISELTNLVQDYQFKFVEKSRDLDNIHLNKFLPFEGALPSYVEVYKDALKNDQKSYVTYKVFHKLPDRICVRLNRFLNGKKINDDVPGALNITIKPDPNLDETIYFDLHGFIVHNGPTYSSGHYIAYLKRNGKWYEASDSSITQISPSIAIDKSKQAYLLFYKKK
ncbi:hypothetical protein [Candidatus Cardinium hertigii]|uniref:hypothetical protein n=1 Tax=Candidatus Cardinium hertigii TaxID=247481 RepID=UPI003D7E1186